MHKSDYDYYNLNFKKLTEGNNSLVFNRLFINTCYIMNTCICMTCFLYDRLVPIQQGDRTKGTNDENDCDRENRIARNNTRPLSIKIH